MTTFSFNANQAKALSDKARSLDGSYLNAETEAILEAIKIEASKGGQFKHISPCDWIIVERLKQLGFTINVWGRPGDEMTTVGW